MRRIAFSVFLLMIFSILCSPTTISLDVPEINPPIPDVILSDTLSFSTYIGGSNNDTVHCVAVDDEDNVYIAGVTESDDLPSSGGPKRPYSASSDYYVMKFTNECELVYTTYIGGTGSEGHPDLHPGGGCWIDVDDSGRVYMTGYTYSSDFPTANAWDSSHNAFADSFALRLSSSGAIIEYSTYLGGSQNDLGTTIAVDDLGNAYITGWTGSPDFPTLAAFDDYLGGSRDNFLLKIDSSGQLNYSTFVGGGVGEFSLGESLVVSADGTAYITGSTESSDFPTLNAYDNTKNGISSDIFFCKVDSSGHLLASSFFGSDYSDGAGAISIDEEGSIYLSGQAGSGFPITQSFSEHPGLFVAKFDSTGENLIYSTGFGDYYSHDTYDLEVDSEGCAYVTGYTYSDDFPTVNPIFDTINGSRDSFVVKLSSGGDHILFSSYLGGDSEEIGLSVAKSSSGSIYLAGLTYSSNFPTSSPLVSTNQEIDGFLVKLADTWPDIPPEPTSPTSTSPSSPTGPITTGPGNGVGLSSFQLTLLLSFGIGLEIIIIYIIIQTRRQPRKSN